MKAMSAGTLERKLKKVLRVVDTQLDDALRALDVHESETPPVVDAVPPGLLEVNYRVKALQVVRARLVKEFPMLATVSRDED